MRFTAGLAVGVTLTLIAWFRGGKIIGRILAVPDDIDSARGSQWRQ